MAANPPPPVAPRKRAAPRSAAGSASRRRARKRPVETAAPPANRRAGRPTRAAEGGNLQGFEIETFRWRGPTPAFAAWAERMKARRYSSVAKRLRLKRGGAKYRYKTYRVRMKSKPSNCTKPSPPCRAKQHGRRNSKPRRNSRHPVHDLFSARRKLLHRRHPQTRYPSQESFLLTRQLTLAHKTVAGLRVNLRFGFRELIRVLAA